jgi:5-dehydro-2-deoxygluconokinase
MAPFDVITTGRVGVDLYPQQSGVSLADVETFAKYLGGSATNVSVQAARLGSRSAVVTKVGDDPFGPFVRTALERFGVDPRWVGTDPVLRTPIVFCEIYPPDHFPLLFYREPKAPDMNLTPEDFDVQAVREATVFWTTGTGLSDEPARSTTLEMLEERSRADGGSRPITIHDLDHRPVFWKSEADAGRWAQEALKHVTVSVGNQDEVAMAVGTRDPEEAAAALLELGVELAIVKKGPEGVLARTRTERVDLAPVRLEVVNGLGAGDAFGGTLAHGLSQGWNLERTIRAANAAGAIAASRLACADDFPTLGEIEDTLERGGSVRG